VVNVRDKANSKGKKLGTLRFAQKVKVTGQDKNTGWYQIKYKGKVGYVSNSYLSTSKPSTGKPSTSKPSKPSTSKPSNDGFVDCDELPWNSDTWGDDMASNGNHGW
jgi:uncharacterized protein YgiM (DUF1202 family)